MNARWLPALLVAVLLAGCLGAGPDTANTADDAAAPVEELVYSYSVNPTEDGGNSSDLAARLHLQRDAQGWTGALDVPGKRHELAVSPAPYRVQVFVGDGVNASVVGQGPDLLQYGGYPLSTIFSLHRSVPDGLDITGLLANGSTTLDLPGGETLRATVHGTTTYRGLRAYNVTTTVSDSREGYNQYVHARPPHVTLRAERQYRFGGRVVGRVTRLVLDGVQGGANLSRPSDARGMPELR